MTEQEIDRSAPKLSRKALRYLSLKNGAHRSRDNGLCAMEAVAWLAGEPHSDHPACTCPVIGAFMRSWNDGLRTDSERDRLLKPLLPLTINTADPTKLNARAFLCIDWLLREFTPAWLEMVETCKVHAEALRKHPEIISWEDLAAIMPVLVDGKKASAAAWAAARAAARDAAWAAAWAAAGDAAGDAAGAAARAAAWAAAGDAAGDAARAAARAALQPTVIELQASAFQLVERMAWLKDEDD